MAGNDTENVQYLTPPAVTALRREARSVDPKNYPTMRTSSSEKMREERQDLREAAEQTLNVIVDLDLEGRVKWVSPSWKQVVGTAPETIEGRLISDVLVDNKSAFCDAIESLKEDDSRSRFIRVSVQLGSDSVLKSLPGTQYLDSEQAGGAGNVEEPSPELEASGSDILNLEGQGIMVYDRTAEGVAHTMWMLRPFSKPREVTIDLPSSLVESLGVGAEVLANYLTVLAEAAANEPDQSKHPAPEPILCRICERQITPWWFEKHSDLCLQEHQAEMDVQIAQENLNEHRHAIVKVLDALEARADRHGRPATLHEGQATPLPQPEYKGQPIGPSPLASAPSSGSASTSSSAPATPPRSRDQSASGIGHGRARSFAVRRPLTRVVELILDLCDTALEINMPVLREARGDNDDEFRTMSPQSESRISQVLQWQSPSSNTLEQEQGLAALCMDTEQVAKSKVDAIVRHRRIVEYAERIRIEYTVLVEECIAAALRKAERIAAGQLSDTSSSDDDGAPVDTIPDAATSSASIFARNAGHESELPPPVSALTMTMHNAPDRSRSGQSSEGKASSVAVSTGPSSPMECPTPRSHKSAIGLLGTSQPSRRGLSLAEFDSGDQSDSSIVSSTIPGAVRTDSPSSDRSLERKRRSLVLPGLSGSPRRQHSPARTSGPHSPLRMPKPRTSTGPENLSSPIVSPSANLGELSLHHYRHHRRQSSTASSDVPRPPVSPHLTTASQPQPRPIPPSIKDFEIIKPISKGAFGSVYLSKKKTTGEYYAIKVLKKADMVAKNQVTNVKAERAIMMWQGESDFVAKLYWTFSSKDYLYLVMEYLNGGDCASLVKILGGLPEDWAKKYIAEVVLGVEHLHSRGIVHRDLKPDNLLIDQKGHLKLTDFGLSRMGLVGRQKRVLKSMNEQAVDTSKQGSLRRATSIASSRSASFDFQGSGSPGSTPLITPDLAGSMPQPSYFSLNQGGLSRQTSRRASGYRSDSGTSENLHGIFRTLSLNEGDETPGALPIPPPPPSDSAHEEETQSEAGGSPYLQPLQPTHSNVSTGTPPQQAAMPPLMALFDPEDHNRRFVGTPDYLAPETINGVGQDEMSDWWSLGCIMFEFLFGYPPFNAATPDEVFENILARNINWPDEIEELASPESINLMNKLMAINPRERIGANLEEKFPNGGAEIRDHPWFSDINWDTLLEDKAQFVPNLENPEDTEYFDARGATLQAFTEEDESSPQPPVTTGSYIDRPHDALYKVRSQVNSIKRPLMPLHIPPHVRETRSRRLSEPSLADDFGNFAFKNLPMLEKANKDVIERMRREALQAQQRQGSSSGAQQPPQSQAPTQAQAQGQGPTPPSSGPSLEGSPLPMSLQRTMSQSKGNNRPASPSALSQANSSPSRPSQPSSPLLVQFSTGHNHERRKTSGSSSTTTSHQSSGSFQPTPVDQSRPANNSKFGSVASSPINTGRVGTHSPDKTVPVQHRQGSAPTTRTRSQTIGSQDGGELSSSLARETYIAGHHKRRSQLFDVSPSSSDNEDPRAKALLKVQRRRQSSRRLSHINIADGPFFRPLDILICEDHPISRLVMERLFEKLRCRTITVANGAEAVRYALSDVQFDMIMTEYKLPQVNGADVARMVRESRSANRHTPIVAVTGYLKDLPEMHHFDTLIEKPPTLTKLTEVLCKFCQWKPPPKDYNPSTFASSSARQTPPAQSEHSPSSTVSSGFALVPSSSYRGSSREDSIGSSYFGDLDSIKAEDVPVIVSRQTDDWAQTAGGLGISEDSNTATESAEAKRESRNTVPFPNLSHAVSSPPALSPSGMLTPRKQRSSEAIRAKRESLERKRYECAESGDDEDEELGTLPPRTQSPRSRPNRPGSKLGIEMMRTNSRGSVISTGDDALKKEKEACEGGRSGNSDDGDESTGAIGKSGRSSLESRFEELSIPEEAILPSIEDELSPNSPSPIALASRSMLLTPDAKPPFSRYIAEIYKRADSRASSESPKRGQVTPPAAIIPSHSQGSNESFPSTPPIVLSDRAEDARSEPSASTPIDSDATPRPMHTPLPDPDAENTPRPGR
ncbi:protein kinase RIM15 [Aspergillus undulatus]|uniref:protein kinase RIM15 n=1 Tax=Aspergillus undulatus TaxID=1810928 RepID=UPI003CCD236B